MQPIRQTVPTMRDPAPSRTAYRLQRLWLTPVFRALMRVGLPTFVLVFSVGLYLSDEGRRQGITAAWAGTWAKVEKRPEFLVNMMAIDGASPPLAEAIRARLALQFPLSSFEIDMEALRAKIEDLDAVARADLRVRSGGVLQVMVTERIPVVIWRTTDELSLLDAEGRRVARVFGRTDRPDLPLIAGDGANDAVLEAMAILAAAEPIEKRLRGLVRMGDRRWDVVLDRDQRILLPELDPVRALERVIALDKAEKLLDRDVVAVDLRNAQRPVLRLSRNALGQLRVARGLVQTGASTP
ncbi:MAG: cell division protein FtsQ [Cereibacter sphaeroides]|uniref:Cell division protein FtsQ n=1 Tax=Cereibacter sphaeroides TaxID=1063 RepID=A0A2W5TMB0_CERSP|nr:MAG: cell division protein FtsQ [Cereibacter sphaeroides]